MITREKTRRTIQTTAALAATAGLVFAMRAVTREIVVRFGLDGGSATAGGEELPLEYAPREYDLGLLIPRGLRFNIGGMDCRKQTRSELAPTEVVLDRTRNEGEAKGWYRLPTTLAEMARNPLQAMMERYITPEGEYVEIGVYPDGDGASKVTEWRAPMMKSAVPSSGSEAPLQDAAAKCGPEIRMMLPKVIGDLVNGNPIQSQLVPRNGGHGYYLTYIAPFEVKAAEAELARRAAAGGWTRNPKMAVPTTGCYVKSNLVLFYQLVPYTAGQTVVICRFADDENMISTKNRKGTDT